MKTYSPKASEVQRQWHVMDASNQILGRMATQVARLLMGKHKPIYAPHMDTGDYVIVVNAAQVRVSGKKLREKIYYHHSGYPKGLKAIPLGEMLAQHPERVMELAVKRMLPQNRLGRQMFKKLKVYAGPTHPHAGQVKGES